MDGYSADCVTLSDPCSSPINACTCEKGLSCHAGHHAVLEVSKVAHKQGIYPGFETQGRPHEKSETRVSAAPQKGMMFSKKYKKRKKLATAETISDVTKLLSCEILSTKKERLNEKL